MDITIFAIRAILRTFDAPSATFDAQTGKSSAGLHHPRPGDAPCTKGLHLDALACRSHASSRASAYGTIRRKPGQCPILHDGKIDGGARRSKNGRARQNPLRSFKTCPRGTQAHVEMCVCVCVCTCEEGKERRNGNASEGRDIVISDRNKTERTYLLYVVHR